MKLVDQPTQHSPSTLFTVRLWRETLGVEPGAVCIQVKHVLSGETRYFRGWLQLTNYLEGKVQATKQSGGAKGENEQASLCGESTQTVL